MYNSYQVMKRASTTYFTSTLLFPQPFRQHIFDLYAFVRTADDFVDKIPQDKKGFINFKSQAINAIEKGKSKNPIIHNFIVLQRQYSIDPKHILAFLDAMESDLNFSEYATYKELSGYIHGSAEVIGIIMSRLMRLPIAADYFAAKMGHAMQLINFIRDIAIDIKLGRVYLPKEDRSKFGVNLPQFQNPTTAELIRFEIDRYHRVHKEAVKGYKFIPHQYLKSIKTAADMYNWTAKKIYQNPNSVFTSTNKPSKFRILLQYCYNSLTV